jgi:hypothetical protein
LNRPTSVDFITALQGFTGSGGHPLKIMRQFQAMGVIPKEWTEKDFDGKAVMIVDNAKDIPSHWNLLIKDKPDFVKAFLLYSEEYGKHKDNLKKTGLDPKLLPEIVRRAHEAGLYVSVHIETATDFHNALIVGADEIAHLPLVDFNTEVGNKVFLISEADARLAARRGVRVITTLGWINNDDDFANNPKRAEEVKQQIIIPNLRLLKRHGVKLLVGSDQFRQTSLPEILLISSLNVFTNLELLKISCEVTPQTVFPKRKIEFLRDGYEASFLVLDGNPAALVKDQDNFVGGQSADLKSWKRSWRRRSNLSPPPTSEIGLSIAATQSHANENRCKPSEIAGKPVFETIIEERR